MNYIEGIIHEAAIDREEDPNRTVFHIIKRDVTGILESLLEEVEGRRSPRIAGGIKGALKRMLKDRKATVKI